VVLIAEHGAIRRGLELYLTAAGLRVVGSAAASDPGLALALSTLPDVVVIDVLPDSGSIEVIGALRVANPRIRVVAYTALGGDAPTAALAAGARGYVCKSGPPEELIDAIFSIAAGGTHISTAAPDGQEPSSPDGSALTRRERAVLYLLGHGMNNAEVAETLVIAPATVRTHVQNAMHKLQARTRTQAIVMVAGREP
jgi:DNA-binding NarL/FixJ family response regulator